MPAPLQVHGELLRSALRPREDERPPHLRTAQEVFQRLLLRPGPDGDDHVMDPFGDRRRGRHLDPHGGPEQVASQPLDLRLERRGEEHRLPLGRDQRHDLAHVIDEPHVEHPVGLVEHEEAGGAEIDQPPPEEILQPAGGGHQDVDAVAEHHLLRPDRNAAEHGGRAHAERLAVVLHAATDLHRQLARRNEDQRAKLAALLVTDLMEDRQGEGGRLAGSGLGASHEVAPGEEVGNGLRLDRRGGLVPARAHRLQQGWSEAKGRKTHQ